jgi:hypothetical protein
MERLDTEGQKRRRLNDTPQQTAMRRAADANRHRRRYVTVAKNEVIMKLL